jgi:hypothetical protein
MEGSFWWKAHLKLLDKFKGISHCNIGDGKTAYLWTDLWSNNCLSQKLPHLASFAKKMDITVHESIHTEFLEDLFHLPLSQEAYLEFQELETLCEATQERINSGEIDKWSYIWNSTEFSTQKAYKALIGYQQCPPHFTWVWNSSCQAKHKFFFWLLLHDRLNTRNLLGRKFFVLTCYDCATLECRQEETLVHLFWSCPFAEECWDFICPQRTKNLSVLEAISNMKDLLKLPFGMDIIILASWSIWIIRNNKIFKNQEARWASWKAIYVNELRMLAFRIKKKFHDQFVDWLHTVT